MRYSVMLATSLSLGLAACGSSEAPDESQPETASEADATPDDRTPTSSEDGDATVEGTDYNATAQIPCGVDSSGPTSTCDAGVVRQWGEDGTTLVEVTKPDGRKRAIFVKDGEPYGADSAEADGSAGWDFDVSREGDRVTITYGPESYVIVDAFVEGG